MGMHGLGFAGGPSGSEGEVQVRQSANIEQLRPSWEMSGQHLAQSRTGNKACKSLC